MDAFYAFPKKGVCGKGGDGQKYVDMALPLL